MTSSGLRAFIGLFTTAAHSCYADRRRTRDRTEKRVLKRRISICSTVAALCLAVSPGGLVAAPGDLDTMFGTGGIVNLDVRRTNHNDRAESVAVLPDGRILVAGHSIVDGDNDFALVRLYGDGSLDRYFGGNGKVIVDVGGINQYDRAQGIALQSDGKILVVGHSDVGNNDDFALVRYHGERGAVDTTFGSGGVVLTDGRGTDENDQGYGVAVQTDGKILVTGYSENGSRLHDTALLQIARQSL